MNLDELTSLSFFGKVWKIRKKGFISGDDREILPQSLNQKLSSMKNIINEADLSNTRWNTHVVISDGGVICIQN